MMNNLNEKLPQSWQQVYDASQQAIDWVGNVRSSSKRLDNEADNLILDLRRLRNTARKLGDVSTKSVAVGFFGLSQAGKSYLISALAADEKGQLETVVDGEVLDFIAHVNPPGGGKEATGLVTRFSRTAKGGISGYPLVLKLFQEVEIVKILTNAYFKDFDQQKLTNKLDYSQLNQTLQYLEKQRSATAIGGICEDDIVDLHDYATENFGNSLDGLKGGYWERAIHLAPYLSIANRGILFSVLWGGLDELSTVYCQFAETLAMLSHAQVVYAPLTVLVKDHNGIKSQVDSIMNVDMLERLNSDKDSSVMLTPCIDEKPIAPVSISLAQLAMLTAELSFPLVNKTRVDTFEQVDLLDFPGYRGRLNLINLSDVKEGNPIAQLLLRGKVAYLFEKYTDSQEMNVLVVCTPSDKQSDVNDVGPVLERWINKTQGETADKRATKKPGLLWAITMFDKRIGASLSLTEDILRASWGKGGLLQQTILERFGNYDWLANWSNSGKFNNVYLVRKPGFPVPFLDLDVQSSQELSLNSTYTDKLALLKQTFTEDKDIQEYIAEPAQTWDAMLKLNDGGMERISQYLEQVAVPSIKQQRIIEQLNEKIEYIVKLRFGSWFQAEGAEELTKKQQTIKNTVANLSKSGILLGDFLHALKLPENVIRAIYQSSHINHNELSLEPSLTTNDAFGDLSLDISDVNLFDDSNETFVETNKKVAIEAESKFAKAVFNAWTDHLRNVILDYHFIQFFAYDQKSTSFLVDELITAATRLHIPEKLTQQVIKNEQTGNKRDELELRQISSTQIIIADFIAWLGFIDHQSGSLPNSQRNQGKKIFESPLSMPLKQHEVAGVTLYELPKLDDNTKNYTVQYVTDWFIAFSKLAQENIGHSAGREISQEQNHRLGEVLNHFNQATIID